MDSAAVVDGLIDSAEYNNNFGDVGVPGSGGLRFCGAGCRGVHSRQQMAPRFQGLDRNNDGRVTRREWDGTNVAFDNQDWNGDNVLSGEEVRAGGRRAGRGLARGRVADYDFDGLDINNNNRIERREWQARLEQFDRPGRQRRQFPEPR